MDVIAHRGFASTGVENALPTLVAAEAHADAVEFDVRLAADGVPVVFHDERVDRLTDAAGPIADFDAAELSALRLAGTDATIPTLAAVLSALSGPIVVDLKLEAGLDAVASQLLEYDARVVASSFRPTTLAALPPAIDRGILASPPADDADWAFPERMPTTMADAVAVADRLDAVAVHPQTSLCDADGVERARAAGLTVNAWTIQDRETAAVMRAAGVDGVIADSPEFVP